MEHAENNWEKAIREFHEELYSVAVNARPEEIKQMRDLLDFALKEGIPLHEARATLQFT